MPKRETLEAIVQSLDPDEIKFFRRRLKRGEGKASVILKIFEAILASKDSNSTRSQRSRLRNEILESMRIKRLHKDVDNVLFWLKKDFQFYYEKGLLHSAYKSLLKAKKMARDHEKISVQLDLITDEIRILSEIGNPKLQEKVRELIEERKALLELFSSEVEVMNTYQSYFATLRSEGSRPFSKVIPYPQPQQGKNSTTSLVYKHGTNAAWSRLQGDIAGLSRHTKLALDAWNKNPLLIEEKSQSYQRLLANYAIALAYLDEYEKGWKAIHELEAINFKNFSEAAEAFHSIALFKLIWALNQGSLSKGDLHKTTSEIEKGMIKFQSKINPGRKLTLWFNLFQLYLIYQDFTRASHWMEEILAHKRHKVVQEIQNSTRIFRLSYFYDLRDFDNLEAALDATYIYFHRYKLIDDQTSAIFRFFRALVNNREDFPREQFIILKQRLEELKAKGIKTRTPGLPLFLNWGMKRSSLN